MHIFVLDVVSTKHRQQSLDFVLLVVRRVLQLSVFEQRIENAQVGMSKCHGVLWQIEKISNENVYKHSKIVRIEVFVRRRSGEEEIHQF